MADRQVSVSVSVVVPESAASRAAFQLTEALVQALPEATQGSVSVVVLEEDQEAGDSA